MDFPFPTYNSNGTINQGPALRDPGNTFWHPPMMPQPQSDSETLWHPPLIPPTKTNTSHVLKRKDYSSSSDESSESCGQIARSCSKTEDSTMGFLHALHDDKLRPTCIRMMRRRFRMWRVDTRCTSTRSSNSETGHGAFFCYFSYMGHYPYTHVLPSLSCSRKLPSCYTLYDTHIHIISHLYITLAPMP